MRGICGVYFLRKDNLIKIGPTSDLRQYYHKMKARGWQYKYYLPASTREEAVRLAEQYHEKLADRDRGRGIFEVDDWSLQGLHRSLGHWPKFWFKFGPGSKKPSGAAAAQQPESTVPAPPVAAEKIAHTAPRPPYVLHF